VLREHAAALGLPLPPLPPLLPLLPFSEESLRKL
jgi:hypothetical protein